jgi:hypothetical protein
MAKIIFKGWKVGMRGIPFVKLLMAKANILLKKALEIKLGIMEGEVIELSVVNIVTAILIILKARKLGVICELKSHKLKL